MSQPLTEEQWSEQRQEAMQSFPEALEAAELPEVLLPYQRRLLDSTAIHDVVICEKSRRIGMTWAVAADAVLTSATIKSDGGMDSIYIGYNLDICLLYTSDAADE